MEEIQEAERRAASLLEETGPERRGGAGRRDRACPAEEARRREEGAEASGPAKASGGRLPRIWAHGELAIPPSPATSWSSSAMSGWTELTGRSSRSGARAAAARKVRLEAAAATCLRISELVRKVEEKRTTFSHFRCSTAMMAVDADATGTQPKRLPRLHSQIGRWMDGPRTWHWVVRETARTAEGPCAQHAM